MKYFGEYAGKQSVTRSLTAVIYHHIENVNFWTSSNVNNILKPTDVNNILTIGNNLYMQVPRLACY